MVFKSIKSLFQKSDNLQLSKINTNLLEITINRSEDEDKSLGFASNKEEFHHIIAKRDTNKKDDANSNKTSTLNLKMNVALGKRLKIRK